MQTRDVFDLVTICVFRPAQCNFRTLSTVLALLECVRHRTMLELYKHDHYEPGIWGVWMRVFTDNILGYNHVECLISGASLWQRILKWTINMRSFFDGRNVLAFILRSQPYTDLEIIALGLMNIIQWNFFFNKVCLKCLLRDVFPGVLFTILTICAVKYHLCCGIGPWHNTICTCTLE